jgi:hypothetical protein
MRKEVTIMTYSKPEIAVLGDAVRLIHVLGKGFGSDLDGSTGNYDMHPAYDLDE